VCILCCVLFNKKKERRTENLQGQYLNKPMVYKDIRKIREAKKYAEKYV